MHRSPLTIDGFYYRHRRGAVHGPVQLGELQALWGVGQIGPLTEVHHPRVRWNTSLPGWQPLASMPDVLNHMPAQISGPDTCATRMLEILQEERAQARLMCGAASTADSAGAAGTSDAEGMAGVSAPGAPGEVGATGVAGSRSSRSSRSGRSSRSTRSPRSTRRGRQQVQRAQQTPPPSDPIRSYTT